MDKRTQQTLLALNKQFYQTFASQFASTRMRLQPGVKAILEKIPSNADILDLGCGNGELSLALRSQNHKGVYIGIDASPGLIEIANQRLQLNNKSNNSQNYRFILTDITKKDWINDLQRHKFDFVFAFAVLHHIPSKKLRIDILNRIHSVLKQTGRFIHSEWQFLNSTRYKSRIHSWTEVNIKPDQVDKEDYLLDWKHGGFGLRYVHLFNEQELEQLAEQTNFSIKETFYSDGETRNLGLYQIWEPVFITNS